MVSYPTNLQPALLGLTRSSGLDTTIAATVQASIYEDLGDIEKLPWVGIGFPLGSVAVILFVGKLYGTFEIKWMFIASVILFEAGSAICGAAPDTDSLIVGRVIAGIGGSGMYLGLVRPVRRIVKYTRT
jgi:MFS family permease